jgi:hypothetical protein
MGRGFALAGPFLRHGKLETRDHIGGAMRKSEGINQEKGRRR